jgi:hypothetical protein
MMEIASLIMYERLIRGYGPYVGSYPGVKSSFKLIILSTHESKHSEQNFLRKILI